MSIVAELIGRLVAAGTPADVAAVAVAEAFAAGAAASVSGGIPVDTAAERRREWDRNRKALKRNSTGIPPERPVDAVLHLSKNSKKEENKREAPQGKFRGTRLPENFLPNEADWQEAVRKLGRAGADLEFQKFVDHWKAAAASKGVKLDWHATWRNWVRNARPGPGRGPPGSGGNSFADVQRDLLDNQPGSKDDSPKFGDFESSGFDLELQANTDR